MSESETNKNKTFSEVSNERGFKQMGIFSPEEHKTGELTWKELLSVLLLDAQANFNLDAYNLKLLQYNLDKIEVAVEAELTKNKVPEINDLEKEFICSYCKKTVSSKTNHATTFEGSTGKWIKCEDEPVTSESEVEGQLYETLLVDKRFHVKSSPNVTWDIDVVTTESVKVTLDEVKKSYPMLEMAKELIDGKIKNMDEVWQAYFRVAKQRDLQIEWFTYWFGAEK